MDKFLATAILSNGQGFTQGIRPKRAVNAPQYGFDNLMSTLAMALLFATGILLGDMINVLLWLRTPPRTVGFHKVARDGGV